MGDLAAYEANMGFYRRAKAVNNWEVALTFLDQAIAACPVDEALPTLAALREEAASQAKPKGFFARLALGVKS